MGDSNPIEARLSNLPVHHEPTHILPSSGLPKPLHRPLSTTDKTLIASSRLITTCLIIILSPIWLKLFAKAEAIR